MLSEFRAWFNNFSGKCEIATTDRSGLTFMGFEIYLFKSFIQLLLTNFYNEKLQKDLNYNSPHLGYRLHSK